MFRQLNAVIGQAIQHLQSGNSAEAKKKLVYVLNVEPKNIAALEILGVLCAQQGDHRQALKHFEKITKIKPDYAGAWSNRGIALQELQQYDQALASYDRAIRIKSDNAEAWSNRGIVLEQLKQIVQALASYDNAIRLNPNYADAWSNRGAALEALQQYEQALISYDKAITINPAFAKAWTNRGNTLQALNQYDLALTSHDKAVSIAPLYTEAWSNRGNTLHALKQYELALASYDKAISLNPDYAEAWSNRGAVLEDVKQFESALASYNKAISLNPEYAQAWTNRGNVLTAIGLFDDAQASHREAIRLDPGHLQAHSNLLMSLNYNNSLSAHDVLNEARRYGSKVSENCKPKFASWHLPSNKEKLTIGFVSGDLRTHSVGYFFEGLIKHLDRNQFEVFAFPTTQASDAFTHRLKPFFTDWVPIYGLSDLDAATLIHQKGIHVLVDLSGHTAHNRLPVFSYKPAPVQATWLGLPVTTGLKEMDFIIGDSLATPIGYENQFTETICRLPDIYLCLTRPAVDIDLGDLPALKNGYITFGSFNNLSKMNKSVIEVWSSILKSTPKSRLVLKSKQLADPGIYQKTQHQFETHGVDAGRLILMSDAMSYEDHLRQYEKMDIALDTFPYPGVTTSAEAICMGVPVLTMRGHRFLSSTATSIAVNAGLPDWVASGSEDYIQKAIHFASDANKLAFLRRSLIDRSPSSPLFDTPRFAKSFGDALWGMWRQGSKNVSLV